MSRRVFIERLTDKQTSDGSPPTVVRVAGQGRDKTLRLPGHEYLRAAEARRLAKWILSHFRKGR